MKKILSIAIAGYLILGLPIAKSKAQNPCQINLTKTPNGSVCAGTTVSLGVSVGGANTGTGVDGTITVNSTLYVDATRSAITGLIGVAGSNSIAVSSASGFSVGDEVLIITMQDATAGAGNLVGRYEFETVSAISSNTLLFTQNLANAYTASGTLKHQVIKVPQYTNVLVSNGGMITCNPWNGSTGGVVCFKASGNVTINAGGLIGANGKGYRGVAQKAALWRNADGGQGEGIYGTGISSGSNGGSSGNNSGAWLSANGNGGGGGTGTGDSGGGGGGGYASAGTGGVNWGHSPGVGGLAVGTSSLTRLIMGGAGGEGGADEDGAYSGAGGNGGGIVYISTNSLTVNGTVSSNGNAGNVASNGSPGSGCGTTAGGGGAGGSIILTINSFSGTGSNVITTGGAGGQSTGGCNGIATTGGAGSNGRIRIDMQGTLPVTNPAAYQGTTTIASGVTYSWSNGANTSSTTVSPNATSNYTITVSAASGCTSASSIIAVNVNPLPVITLNNGAICAGQTFTIIPSGASSYSYSGGSSIVSPSLTTNYTVTGTSSGCVGSGVSSVTVNPIPIIGVSNGTICAGASFTINPSGASSYTIQGGSAVVTPNSNTSYTVNGTSTEGCVGNVSSSSITVNSLPVINITGTNAVCAGNAVNLTGSGANTYTWSNSTNQTSISVIPTVSTNYSLTGTSVEGCVGNTAIATITVNALPVVSISGNSSICAGSTTTLTVSGANSYVWNTGSTNSLVTVSPLSNTSYTVVGTSVYGCVTTGVTGVTVNALPVVSINGNISICSGESSLLIANGAITYTWNTSAVSPSISASPIVNTSYSVSGTDALGCVGNSGVTTMTVNSLPAISITGTNAICLGGSSNLTANGASTYTWSNSSNQTSVLVTPTVTTSYSITGTSAEGCVGNTAVVNVTVNALPVVSITGTASVCAGSSAILTASGANSYTWNTGSNNSVITVSPLSNTSYTAVGTNAAGCLGSAVNTLSVNSLPILGVVGNNTICSGSTATLNANGASSYTWSTASNNASIVISPLTTTSYSVSGTNSLGCVGNTAFTTITVNAIPAVVITSTNAVCAGGSINLTAGGANTYTWNTGSNANFIIVTPTANVTYTLIGMSSAGCSTLAVTNITVNANPVLNISGSTGICTGQNANLTVSGASSYLWNTGATTNTFVATPLNNTTYTVTGTSALGCVTTTTQLVTVQLSLSVSIVGPSAICEGQPANLSGLGAASYTWNTGAVSLTIAPSPSVTTTYSVIGTSGTCSNTASKTITVNPNPIVTITATTGICSGDSLILVAGGANTYNWNTGSTSNSIVVSPSVTSTYTLIGSYLTGCSKSVSDTITVYALPLLTISGNGTICLGDSTVLTANGASSYAWNTSTTSNTILVNPIVNTVYSVIGTSAEGCVGNIVSDTIVVNPLPTINVLATATTICAGDSLSMTVSGANFYSWSNGSSDSLIMVMPNVNTSYTVTGTSAYACSSYAVASITVNALPVITIAGASTICLGETLSLTANGANTYTWDSGQSTVSVVNSPSINTTYSVKGTSTEGCKGMSSLQVTVSECTGIANNGSTYTHVKLYPNPNHGNFTIELSGNFASSIVIRNVLGQVIYTQKADMVNQIDLGRFDKGLYFIQILENNQTVYRANVIKE